MNLRLVLFFAALLAFQACNKDTDPPIPDMMDDDEIVEEDPKMPYLPIQPFNYIDVDLPAGFTTGLLQLLDNDNFQNPITNEGATLGRVLFYDTFPF